MLLGSAASLTGLVTPLAVPESVWRARAQAHTERVRQLLSPGFVPVGAVTRGRRLVDLHTFMRGMMRRAWSGRVRDRAGCGLQPYMGKDKDMERTDK